MALLRLRFPTMYPLDLARAIDLEGSEYGYCGMHHRCFEHARSFACRPATLKVAGDERTGGSAEREPADLVQYSCLSKRLDSTCSTDMRTQKKGSRLGSIEATARLGSLLASRGTLKSLMR